MANRKISQLTPNTNPSNAGELPIVESGVTDKVSAQNLITKAHGLGSNAVPVIDGSGVMTPVATNVTPGYVLTSDGTTASFQAPALGTLSPDSTVITDNTGAITTVANGAVGEILTADGLGGVSYQAPAVVTYSADSTLVTDNTGNVSTVANGAAGEVLTADGLGGVSYQAPAPSGQIVYDAIVAPVGGDYTTLGAAVAAASAGWTILVRPGTYTENDIIHSVSDLTIVGSGIGNTELSFASNQSYNDSGSNRLNLSNLTMTFNGGYAAFYGDKTILNNLQINVSNTPVLSNPITIAGDDGLFTNLNYNDTTAAHNITAVDVTGSRNRFNNCTFNINIGGYTSFSNRAIDTENTDYTQFYNCVFNITNAPNVGCSILFHNNTTALIVDNCIFTNATPSDEYAIYDNNAVGSKITNSVFKDFGYAIYVQSGTGDTLVDANQITSVTTSGIAIDLDYGIGCIVSNNKITLNGGASTGIRLWNAGEEHNVSSNVIDTADTGIFIDAGVFNTTVSSNTFRNITAGFEINGANATTKIVNGPALYDAVIDINGFGQYISFQQAWADTLTNKTIFVKQGLYLDIAQTYTNADTNVTFIGDGKSITNYVLLGSSFTGNGSYTFKNMSIVLADLIGTPGDATFTGAVKFVDCNLVIDSNPLSYFNFNSPANITEFRNCFLITKDSDGTNSQFRFDGPSAITDSTFLLGLDFTSDISNVCSFSSSFNTLQGTAVVYLSAVFTSLVDAPMKFTGDANQILGNGFVTQFVTAGATGALLNIQGSNNIINSNTFTNLGLLEATGIYISGGSALLNKIVGNTFTSLYRGVHLENDGYQVISDNTLDTAAIADGVFVYVNTGLLGTFGWSVIANNIASNQAGALSTVVWIEDSQSFVVQGNILAGADTGIYLGATSDFNRVYGNHIDVAVTAIDDNGAANVVGTTGSYTVGTNTIDVSEGIVTSIV